MKSHRYSKVCAKILSPRNLNEIYKTGRTDVRGEKIIHAQKLWRMPAPPLPKAVSNSRITREQKIALTLAFLMMHVNRVIFMIVWGSLRHSLLRRWHCSGFRFWGIACTLKANSSNRMVFFFVNVFLREISFIFCFTWHKNC